MNGTETDLVETRQARAGRARDAEFRLHRILVATAGEPNAAGALRLAAELGRRHGAEVRVVSVFQPPIPYPVRAGERPNLEPAHREEVDARMERVRQQLTELGDVEAAWPVSCEIGVQGRCMVEEAQHRSADLIVVGLGRPRPYERRLGDRALLELAHYTDRPLLAACVDAESLPRTIVLGIGQNGEVFRLVRMLAIVAAEGADVHLVHVREHGESDGDAHDRSLLLDQVESELRGHGFVTKRVEVDGGAAARRLVAYARGVKADLIVGGLHGEGFMARSIVRNTAMHLAAEAPCSVMLIPRAEP